MRGKTLYADACIVKACDKFELSHFPTIPLYTTGRDIERKFPGKAKFSTRVVFSMIQNVKEQFIRPTSSR
jgi:hypothetical protein